MSAKFESNRAMIGEVYSRAIDKAVQRMAITCANLAKIESSKGYIAGKTTKGRNIYRSSPRGAYPGLRTGTFAASLTSRKVGHWLAAFGSNVKYARRLDLGFFGRDSRGRVYYQHPRPWGRRTVVANAARLRSDFERDVIALVSRDL